VAADARPAPLAGSPLEAGRVDLEVDLVERQEGGAVAAVVDEGGLEGAVHPLDDRLVDVAFDVLAGKGLDLEQIEHAVVDDGDAVLLLRRDIDQHGLGHRIRISSAPFGHPPTIGMRGRARHAAGSTGTPAPSGAWA
jgi:hypothetical protein